MITKNETHVLIAGCGDVGSALANRLIAENFKVWGLRRNIETLPKGIIPVAADLTSPTRPENWPDHIDYLVYSAAAKGRTPESYQRAYIDGLKNVLNWTRTNNKHPKRILFTSSTSIYHQSHGEWLDETSPTEPTSFAGQTMQEAEQLLINEDIPATSVRFGGIYGPGRGRMIQQIKEGKGYAAEPVSWSNRIHRDDCAGVLAHLIHLDMKGSKLADCYLAVDDQPAPLHQVTQWLAQQLGVSIKEHQESRRGSKRCRNALIRQTGYRFIYPGYQSGYAALLNSDDATL